MVISIRALSELLQSLRIVSVYQQRPTTVYVSIIIIISSEGGPTLRERTHLLVFKEESSSSWGPVKRRRTIYSGVDRTAGVY